MSVNGTALSEISIANARLPETYENAKAALAQCSQIDECHDWANKAEALASYAKQADDDTLRKMADRIQARAVQRCGQLLKTFNAPGARTDKPNNGTVVRSQKEAATQAGMSQRQRETAVRVANVPPEQFETQVESDSPPTVTSLAEQGRRTRDWTPPEGFQEATHVLGAMRRFAEKCAEHEPELIAAGVRPHEVAEIQERVSAIDAWLDRFIVNVRESP